MLRFGGAGDVEICGALAEDSRLVGFAHEEGEGEEDESEEKYGPLGPAPAFAADDEAADEGTRRVSF